MEEHHTVPEGPAVWEDPGCTAGGSPEVDRSPAEADRNFEAVRRTAEEADRTDVAEEAGCTVVAEEVGRRYYHCNSHLRGYDLREQHRQKLHENHYGMAASLAWRSLFVNYSEVIMIAVCEGAHR